MKFGFVVLHYLSFEDTIQCVNSVLPIIGQHDVKIVIVDNHSNNGSLERLEQEYASNEAIAIVPNNDNLGFARGNNVGYTLCRDVYHCDCIMVSNNDIIVESPDLFDVIEQEAPDSGCAVIGPDIMSGKTGHHQNPVKPVHFNHKMIKKEILRYRLLSLFNTLNVYDFARKCLGQTSGVSTATGTSFEPKSMCSPDIQLHGSFLIFLKPYITIFDTAFDSRTFLYMEEDILRMRCESKDLRMCYWDNLRVIHNEDSSTDMLTKKVKKKRSFVFRNMIQSYEVLDKVILEYDIEKSR